MNKRKSTLTAVAILSALTIFLSCSLGGTPKISLRSAKLVPSIVDGAPAAAFMLIVNDGKGDDLLKGCSLKEHPSARGELHDFVGGRMTMVQSIEIAAEEITVLKRGGLHMMFFNVPEKFGDEVTLLLDFAKSGTIEVKATVQYHGTVTS